MNCFATLYRDLEEENQEDAQKKRIVRYLRESSPRDIMWMLTLFCKPHPQRVCSPALLKDWAMECSSTPPWLFEQCYEHVGDLAETAALILPHGKGNASRPLHEWMELEFLPLYARSATDRKRCVIVSWQRLEPQARFVWNKCLTGTLKMPVPNRVLIQALSQFAECSEAEMVVRLSQTWKPTLDDFQSLVRPISSSSKNSEFHAEFLEWPDWKKSLAELGDIGHWRAIWAGTGLRAQCLRLEKQALLKSIEGDWLTQDCPEIISEAQWLPVGTVLEGEICVEPEGRQETIAQLKRRFRRNTGRSSNQPNKRCVFVVLDLLSSGNQDWRRRPFIERQQELHRLLDLCDRARSQAAAEDSRSSFHPELFEASAPSSPPAQHPASIRLSQEAPMHSWTTLDSEMAAHRSKRGTGFILHSLQTAERWWWQSPPHQMNFVILNRVTPSPGSGNPLDTFGLGIRYQDEWLSVGTATLSPNFTESELFLEWVQAAVIQKRGPVRLLRPDRVVTVEFDRVEPSQRHRAALAIRDARILNWGNSIRVESIVHLDALKSLILARD